MKKNLAAYVLLGLVALIAVAIMVMYFVPVNYVPTFNAKYTSVEVYQNSEKHATYNEHTEEFAKVVGDYNASFKQNLLSAIFAGQTSGMGIVSSTSEKYNFDKYVILWLEGSEGHDLVINGKKQPEKVLNVVVGVTDVAGFRTVKVYFNQAENHNKYYVVNTFANQSTLYKTINGFDIP